MAFNQRRSPRTAGVPRQVRNAWPAFTAVPAPDFLSAPAISNKIAQT
ncbi:MAG: hypothetical protein DKINENOH_05459 [bacterium]|nr:hypothetical protein [bacterium]